MSVGNHLVVTSGNTIAVDKVSQLGKQQGFFSSHNPPPPKSFEKKGKRTKTTGNLQKKNTNPRKQGVGGSGMVMAFLLKLFQDKYFLELETGARKMIQVVLVIHVLETER